MEVKGKMLDPSNARIAIVGLGYVGLPLAVEFGKQLPTIGFDINMQRITELRDGIDNSLEVESDELRSSPQLTYTTELEKLRDCNTFIVTVPTPIDRYNRPDLSPLIAASRAVGSILRQDSVVIYESTVYPGCTEEVCVPILEEVSGLKFNHDFFVGYSPERINPGDKEHRLINITKVTSGSTPEAADYVDGLYQRIIQAGTYKTTSIRAAEAAKVIENTQRDVNIALINELALIFERLGLDTEEVLKAAGSKWNFLRFMPGLVGGHCIGVDPYYLTHKAQEIGYHPEVILAGRRINDGMGAHVAERVVKIMTKRRIPVVGSNILVMGLTFKENCPDIRNTRVIDLITEFQDYSANVEVYDPWANTDEVEREYGFKLIQQLANAKYDAIVLAVAHRQFIAMGPQAIRALGRNQSVIFDVKYVLPAESVDGRL